MVSWKENINGMILASNSARRKEILKDLGLEFFVETADIGDEMKFFENETDIKKPLKLLARKKNAPISEKYPDIPVLSADTVVFFDKKVFGKPKNANEARYMLRMFSGKMHSVYTAVNLVCKLAGFDETILEKTDVFFREIEEDELEEYIETATFLDKAGGYAIQEDGKFFVEKINGDYWNVVGLPLAATIKLLRKYITEIK
jgi:septum formation protein